MHFNSEYEARLHRVNQIDNKWSKLEKLDIAGELIGVVFAVILPENLKPVGSITLSEAIPAELPKTTLQPSQNNQ